MLTKARSMVLARPWRRQKATLKSSVRYVGALVVLVEAHDAESGLSSK